MSGGSNWLSIHHINQVVQCDEKIKAIMWYFYDCEDYTQTFSTFHRDACIDKRFNNLIRFSTDYSFLLSHMVKKEMLETWHDDEKNHTYYRLSKKYRRQANLKKLS